MKQLPLCILVVATFFLINSSAYPEPLDEFISPVSNPFTFEDPRALTETRLTYFYQGINEEFFSAGGDVRSYNLQLRFALDRNLSLLISKAGFIDLNPDSAFSDQSGWSDLTIGPKLTLYGEGPMVASVGLKYDIPLGSKDVFQGEGDGSFNPFLSATGAWGPLNITAGTGVRIAVDNEESSFYDFDLHVDTPLGNLFPLLEFNVNHVIDGGKRLSIQDEGFDFLNFGATDADGETVVAMGIGARYRVTPRCDMGLIYQFPLTDGTGSNFLDWRIIADLVFNLAPERSWRTEN